MTIADCQIANWKRAARTICILAFCNSQFAISCRLLLSRGRFAPRKCCAKNETLCRYSVSGENGNLMTVSRNVRQSITLQAPLLTAHQVRGRLFRLSSAACLPSHQRRPAPIALAFFRHPGENAISKRHLTFGFGRRQARRFCLANSNVPRNTWPGDHYVRLRKARQNSMAAHAQCDSLLRLLK